MQYVKRRDVEIQIQIEPEQVPYRGNASAIGPEEDERTIRYIERRLAAGNDWAWCTVRVVATWRGYTGDAYLGCCSYPSERAFRRDSGAYRAMVDDAIADLNARIASDEHR